jgi:hypothetical protein
MKKSRRANDAELVRWSTAPPLQGRIVQGIARIAEMLIRISEKKSLANRKRGERENEQKKTRTEKPSIKSIEIK